MAYENLKTEALSLIAQIIADAGPGESVPLSRCRKRLIELEISMEHPAAMALLVQLVSYLRTYSFDRHKPDDYIRPREDAIIHPQTTFREDKNAQSAREVEEYVRDLLNVLGVVDSPPYEECTYKTRNKRRRSSETSHVEIEEVVQLESVSSEED